MAKNQTLNVLEGYRASCDGPYRSLVCTVFIKLSGNTGGRALETKTRLRLSKTSISIAFGGWGSCARRDVPRGAEKHHLGPSGKHWIIFALFTAVDEFVFCRQRGWSRVARLNLYLIHVHVLYTEAGQSFMAVARIKPASNGGVLLCANCMWGLLNLQSPSKQRIQRVRLKNTNHCEAGRKGSNMIISPLWTPWVSLGHWKLPYNLTMCLSLLQIWNKSKFSLFSHKSNILVI